MQQQGPKSRRPADAGLLYLFWWVGLLRDELKAVLGRVGFRSAIGVKKVHLRKVFRFRESSDLCEDPDALLRVELLEFGRDNRVKHIPARPRRLNKSYQLGILHFDRRCDLGSALIAARELLRPHINTGAQGNANDARDHQPLVYPK